MNNGPLKHDQDNDYTFNEEEGSVWVTIGNFSVYLVLREDGEVATFIYPKGFEMENDRIDACGTSNAWDDFKPGE